MSDVKWWGEPNKYSTDERVVGEWIDGKPIYQKTFYKADFSIGTTFTNVIFGSVGANVIDTIVDLRGVYNNWEAMPFYRHQSLACDLNCGASTGEIQAEFYRFGASAISNNFAYITIQYTKTTD